MIYKQEATVNERSILGEVFSWVLGIVFLAIGLINTFWGNDRGYGIFVSLLSLAFFPPVTILLKKLTGLSIPFVVKLIIAILTPWTALGVGELFDKINLMLKDF